MLIEQSRLLQEVAGDLELIFDDFANVAAFKGINGKEDEADALCREISRQLSQTFITPIDREDIYRIQQIQEDSINILKNIAVRAKTSSLARSRFPARKLVAHASVMAKATGKMIEAVKDGQEVSHLVRQIHSLKGECEMLLGTGLAELNDMEVADFKSVVDIIKWVQIYDRIELVIGRIDDLSDAIEEVVLKNA
jgi:uncharacterized protein Yka (UPF0111/DUF47 family)